jgi:O-antigen/teichoic acid export membrane protein
MRNLLRSWWQDNLLRGVLKNTSFLFSSNSITAAVSMAGSILATRLIGYAGFGLVGIIQTFASNINRLLSFRMSEVVVKYLGESLAIKELSTGSHSQVPSEDIHKSTSNPQAAAIVKGIALVEAVTSALAYLVLVLLAFWAARLFAKDISVAPLFSFYGLMLLGNLVYETSTGVLQAHKRFDHIAIINTIQSAITLVLIVLAFIFKKGVFEVLGAYLLGKSFAGVSISIMAFRQMSHSLGGGWWHTPLRQVKAWRGMIGFAVNTNLNGTVNLITRDNILLYLTWLSPITLAQDYAGYFKWGLAIINFVTLPIDPFIWPTYTEITRTIAQRHWQKTRKLLKQVSTIAGTWTFIAAAGVAILGWWLIPLLLGSNTIPIYYITLILLIGYGIANVMNWNRTLLLAFGKPAYPLLIAAAVGSIEVLLTLWLVPNGGYLAMAAILSGYLGLSVSLTAWRGWHEIRAQEAKDILLIDPASKDVAA